MTRGPTRLKDDADFQWETGCNVADEELVVGSYDHATLRSRIVAGALATGAAATTAVLVAHGMPTVTRVTGWTIAAAWKPIVGLTAGAAILAGTYWLGVQSRPTPSGDDGGGHTPAPISAPAILDVEPQPDRVPMRSEEATTPPAATLETGSPMAGPAAVESVPAPVPADATLDAAPSQDAPPHLSALPEQIYVMDVAATALREGDYLRAEQMYERYLAEWPSGPQVPEATIGLLQARFGRGDAAGAEALAKKMQGDPTFFEEREEILRFRAESLVQLNRCREALDLAEELSDRSAARNVRGACRHREGD